MRDLSTPGIAFSDWKIIAESAYTWPRPVVVVELRGIGS